MEYWVLKTDDDLISISNSCEQHKIQHHSAKPIVPTFQYSIIPPHACKVQPIISDLALLPARRAYSLEGGPGFLWWFKDIDFALHEVVKIRFNFRCVFGQILDCQLARQNDHQRAVKLQLIGINLNKYVIVFMNRWTQQSSTGG